MSYTKREILTLGSQIATMGAAIFAAVSLFYILESIDNTELQIDSIQKLIASSNRTADILEETKIEEQHQSILDTYSSLGEISLVFQCFTDPFQGNNIIIEPKVLDEKNKQTFVPLKMHFFFNIYGKSSVSENYTEMGNVKISPYKYNFDEGNNRKSLNMDPIYEYAATEGFSEIKIEMYYLYSLDSPYKDVDFPLVLKETPSLFTELHKENGNWLLDNPYPSHCRMTE